MSKNVVIQVTLPEEQASKFALFLSRNGFIDYESTATSEKEAYEMMHAGEAVLECFRKQGYGPQ